MFFYDWTYFLVLLGAVLCMMASAKMRSTYARYSQVRSMSGLTGRETAQRILAANGIYDVTVNRVPGDLTDHYDPNKKVVNLSESIYDSPSIAAVSVAAHECGHAIQDNTDYLPLRIRAALVPVANIGAQASWPLILIGVFLASFGSAFVEFNASNRALVQLDSMNLVPDQELPYARKVLGAAALTYVASASASLLQLLRLYLLFGGRRRRD